MAVQLFAVELPLGGPAGRETVAQVWGVRPFCASFGLQGTKHESKTIAPHRFVVGVHCNGN